MSKRPGSPLEPDGASKFFRALDSQHVHDVAMPPSTEDETHEESKLGSGSSQPGPLNNTSNEETKPAIETLSFEQLLCFHENLTPEDIDARFQRIAQLLVSEYRIRITRRLTPPSATSAEVEGQLELEQEQEQDRAPTAKNEKTVDLQVMEMEFYLIYPGAHEDPYCHGSAEQCQAGVWYFHRAPKWNYDATSGSSVGGAYRDGSRKGLDLTIGSIPVSSHSTSVQNDAFRPRGGVLLRSARVINTGAIISGPSLLVDFILKSAGADNITSLVNDHWDNNISAFTTEGSGNGSRMSIVRVDAPDAPTKSTPSIYRTPRVGLDLSHYTTKPETTHPRVQYVQKQYRFLIEPSLLKVNGRAQTFAGILRHVFTLKKETGNIFAKKRPAGSSSMSNTNNVRIRALSEAEQKWFRGQIAELGGFTQNTCTAYMSHFFKGFKGGQSVVKVCCGKDGKGVCQSPEKVLMMFGALEAFCS